MDSKTSYKSQNGLLLCHFLYQKLSNNFTTRSTQFGPKLVSNLPELQHAISIALHAEPRIVQEFRRDPTPRGRKGAQETRGIEPGAAKKPRFN